MNRFVLNQKLMQKNVGAFETLVDDQQVQNMDYYKVNLVPNCKGIENTLH